MIPGYPLTLFSQKSIDVAGAKSVRVLNKFLAEEACHLPMIEGLLMLVQLAQHCAKLEVTLAQVAKFEQFAGDVKFLGSLHHILLLLLCGVLIMVLDIVLLRDLLLLLHGEHLLDDPLVVIEVGDLGLQVVDRAIEVGGAIL
jgi:hypothetical protein